MLNEFDVSAFQYQLLDWFERNLRDLPWRRVRDPYKIWVSEIMLQQTRVDTVIPYYERFMDKFPTLEDLSEAKEEDVLKMWEGLGYYSRARNLHAGVKEVQATYGGRVPDDPEEIRRIKGIGPYTAGAILSIAYGVPEPAVDGNVMRVLSRLLFIQENIQKVKTRKRFEEIIREIIAKENPSYFNQALMELGALICTPRSPKCEICPVFSHCLAMKLEVQEQLPIKGKAKPPKPVSIAVAFLEQNDQILIRQRPNEGLLAGLWELPNVEGKREELEEYFQKQNIELGSISLIMEYQHIFSHLQWNMEVFHVDVDEVNSNIGKWVHWEELSQYTFPVSFQKIIGRLREVNDLD